MAGRGAEDGRRRLGRGRGRGGAASLSGCVGSGWSRNQGTAREMRRGGLGLLQSGIWVGIGSSSDRWKQACCKNCEGTEKEEVLLVLATEKPNKEEAEEKAADSSCRGLQLWIGKSWLSLSLAILSWR